MEPISTVTILSSLSSLAISWMEERKKNNESTDAAAFRDWLKNDAIDQLVKNADQTLKSVISLKAQSNKKLDHITLLIEDIYDEIFGSSVKKQWDELQDLDRKFLEGIYHASLERGELDYFSVPKLAERCDFDKAELVETVGVLRTKGFTAEETGSNGLHDVRLTDAGALFVWEATAEDGYQCGIESIEDQLLLGVKSVGQISESVRIPIVLVAAYLNHLKTNNEVTLVKHGGRGNTTIFDVSHQLRRRVKERQSKTN